jgi:hypothetical protein
MWPTTNTGWPFRLVRKSLSTRCVAVATEKFPLELVPAVGISLLRKQATGYGLIRFPIANRL